VRGQFHHGRLVYVTRLLPRDPRERRLSILYRRALKRGAWILEKRRAAPVATLSALTRRPGISVVIPSRNGSQLLQSCLPKIAGADEIIVVDNGSNDDTRAMLARDFSSVILEHNGEPLSFARAVNRGIARARY